MLVLNDTAAEQHFRSALAYADNLWRILSAKYGATKGLRAFKTLVGERKYHELQEAGFTTASGE